jgi:hypothetical protein
MASPPPVSSVAFPSPFTIWLPSTT